MAKNVSNMFARWRASFIRLHSQMRPKTSTLWPQNSTEDKTLSEYNPVRCRYPDESGYGTTVLVYNWIFNIRTTLAAIFVSISEPDIGHSRNKDGGRNSISELKSIRISRFSGYRASGYCHLTVLYYYQRLYYQKQRNLTVPGNITSKQFLKKLACSFLMERFAD
jgi:hypothetical protein